MSDILNIRVTEAELDLIMLLLEQAGTMEDSNGQPAFELLHDLMEQSGDSDEWEPTEIAEDTMFNAGVTAREQVKRDEQQRFGEFDVGTSEAAERRNERMMRGTTATLANDPVDW